MTQKTGEKVRITSLVQECIICKQKNFYKRNRNSDKNITKTEESKTEEITDEVFCIFKDMYHQTKRATSMSSTMGETRTTRPFSVKFYNTGDEKKALQASRKETKK